MKPLDCKGEINKCKIDIADNRQSKILKKLLAKIKRMDKLKSKKY